jgi:hypothetical protein
MLLVRPSESASFMRLRLFTSFSFSSSVGPDKDYLDSNTPPINISLPSLWNLDDLRSCCSKNLIPVSTTKEHKAK